MSSNMILPIHEVLETYAGAQERDRIFQEAGLKFLPSPKTRSGSDLSRNSIREFVVICLKFGATSW